MRLSQLFTKTAKESRMDASSVNADLLTRAGFIDKTMAGVYAFLPLGVRVLRKIEDILREEMDKISAEVFLPAVSPTDFWEKTGRLDSVNVLFQVTPANAASKDLHDARYILNSTHEEIITPIFQRFVKSYQDLPAAAYQIQTKFRNEPRPKSGVLRTREFRMKDLYSFHATEEDMLDYLHRRAKPAYQAFFDRVGLGNGRTVEVFASGGDFSRQHSVEFQTRCDMGEDLVFYDPKSGVHWNREIAPCVAPQWGDPREKERAREDVTGEGIIGVEELAAFLTIEVERTTKTLLFSTENGMVAAAVRGGYDVNEEKLRAVLGCRTLRLASAEEVLRVTGAEVGYAGPIGLPEDVTVIWDDSTRGRKNFECGANETHKHSTNVNFGRDVPLPREFHDIKVAREGDLVPATGKPYETFRASEVGNLFTLYTKFSDAFGFTYRDRDGKDKPVYMGSYGIGTTRVLGVLAEVFHDEFGLLWPEDVAPARVHFVAIAKKASDAAYTEAEKLYDDLMTKGVECLFDDRLHLSVGERLADADLIGVPKRVIVSEKTLRAKSAELKDRATGSLIMLPLAEVLGTLSHR